MGPNQTVVAYVGHLQVDGQQRGVPVIGDEDQVVVAVGGAPAGHVPGRLQRRLAQQRAPAQAGTQTPLGSGLSRNALRAERTLWRLHGLGLCS